MVQEAQEVEGWSAEEEQAVMAKVFGRVPPSSQESAALASETRLLRQQMELLIEEIRLLRGSIQVAPPTKASFATPSPTLPPATPTPTPQLQKTPFSSKSPPAPVAQPTPRSTFPTAAPSWQQPQSGQQAQAAQPMASTVSSVSAPSGTTAARIVSAGFNDGNVADFYLDDRRIDIRGQSYRRGLNVVTIDPTTQQVTSRKTYDVWGDPGTENPRLAADLNSLPEGRIVMVALKDSGLENLDADVVRALAGVGATITGRLPVREGYALIGVKGGTALAEKQAPRAEIQAALPCAVRPPPPLPPAPPAPPAPSTPSMLQPQFNAATASWSPGAAAPAMAQPRSTFPTPPRPPPAARVASQPPLEPQQRAPKLEVDPQGRISFNDALAERDAGSGEDGQSWQEVVFMLDKLQEKIKAKRLAGTSSG